jgi:amino acid adenylation domain-containing protein
MAGTFWKRILDGFSSPTPLPGAARSGDRTNVPTGFAEVRLSAGTLANLRAFAAKHGFDLRSIITGAWAIVLSRYSGEEDVVFGICDPQDAASSQILPIRLRTNGDRLLLPWLAGIRDTLANQAATTKDTVPDWSSALDGAPLFESAVLFETPEIPSLLPLLLHVSVSPELSIAATYDGARFCEGAIPRVLRHAATILESMPECAPDCLSALPLMADAELRNLVIERNNTQTDYRDGTCIHQWFEEQVARTPEATAVVFRDQKLTYRELDAKAQRVAARLGELGAAPDGIVALCAERSLEMMVGLLGILKSGSAYLPLDPAFPAERMQFMLEDSGVPIVLTHDHLAERFTGARTHVVSIRSIWDEAKITELPSSSVKSPNLAYVIYTSGSTGKPKGVMVEHRNVSNFFSGMDQVIGREPGVWLAVTSISFDISVLELFWTLARGFTVVLQAESEKLASAGNYSVAAQIARHHVTHLQCTPSMARFLISSQESLESLRGLRKLMLGGEALPSGLVAQLRQVVSGEIFNLYGPTETTVWSAAHRIVRDEAVIPIGRPIANTQIYILDEHLRPAPLGAPGELFIAGAGVTRGYLHRPELTATRFLPDPFRSESANRMYRTGDLARYRPDGGLEFLGRIDNQVKILGFRIEPEEIEAVLGQHPDIRAIAVVVREDAPGEKTLVAWLVSGERPITVPELRSYAQHRLPAHMVPSAFVIVDSLPQTPNRKIDKKALAALPLTTAVSGQAPVTSLEETVGNIFREALQLEAVSTHGNFFDLGANSLVMAQVAITLQETLHREILLTDLFKYPTINSLAAFLAQRSEAEPPLRRASGRAQSRKDAFLDRSGDGHSLGREHKHR